MAEVYDFAASIARWIEDTKGSQEQAVRAIGMQILGRLVERSPVGNPELWKANQPAVRANIKARETRAANKDLKRRIHAAGGSAYSYRKQKAAVGKLRKLSAGRGYTGGRFRGNWQVSFDRPAVGPIDRIDKRGGATLAAGREVLQVYDPDKDKYIYFSNMVPYARRLEYGWSNQAPQGIVRVTVAEIKAKL